MFGRLFEGIDPIPFVLFTAFGLMGCALVVGALRSAVAAARAARTWTPVTGVVTQLRPDAAEVPHGELKPVLAFEVGYEFPPGVPRTMTTDASTATGRVDVGSPMTVHVNPHDPKDAMVLAGWVGVRGQSWFFGLIGGLFLVVGIIGLTLMFW